MGELNLCRPTLGSTASCCWGAWGGVRGRKGPGSWTSREGSAACPGPGPEWKAVNFVFKETRLHCAREPSPPSPVVSGQQPASPGGQNPRSASAACQGLQPAGSQQGLRTTARALPGDFHPGPQPPGQGGGSGPPGKLSTRAPNRRREVRGSWEPAFPWRPGAWASCASAPELPSVPAFPGPQFPTCEGAGSI